MASHEAKPPSSISRAADGTDKPYLYDERGSGPLERATKRQRPLPTPAGTSFAMPQASASSLQSAPYAALSAPSPPVFRSLQAAQTLGAPQDGETPASQSQSVHNASGSASSASPSMDEHVHVVEVDDELAKRMSEFGLLWWWCWTK